MDETTLQEKLNELNVYETLKSLDHQLSTLPPDGKTNHRKNGIRNCLFGFLDRYKLFKSYCQGEKFSYFQTRRPNIYQDLITTIQEAKSDFKVKI